MPEFNLATFDAERPTGSSRAKVSDPEMIAKISLEWQDMTQAERIAITDPIILELTAARDAKRAQAVPRVSWDCAKDVQKTMKKVEREVSTITIFTVSVTDQSAAGPTT